MIGGNTTIEAALSSTFIELLPASVEIDCYPNPVQDILYINNLKRSNAISLVNAQGKNMFYKISNGSTEQIKVNQFTPGLYILYILNGEKIIFSQRIVKE
jgi:hypothetical protein